ncbi:cytochrome c biogenesis protein ResB [Thalassiella azotivora]
MRTALYLLAALALAAVPGSLLPQRGVASDPNAVARFRTDNPVIAPWLDRFGFFEVYSSPWFAAIYLLLLTSMTGCVLPRCLRLWRAARAQPPRAPRNLARLPGRSWASAGDQQQELTSAARELRRRRYRVVVDGDTVRAEKGYLREIGNLAFHLSLLVLLVGVAAGSLLGFEGRVIVAESQGFSNTRSQYDEFTPGPLVDETSLTPFSFTLERFSASFEPDGPQRGTPRDFRADVHVVTPQGRAESQQTIEVNHPLEIDGTKVFLTGNGYAPRVTVRDGTGEAVFSGPVVFLPLDGNLTSEGVVKAPDARPTQLGFEGLFLPTAAVDPTTGPTSLFPAALDPRLVLTAFTGDLGLGDGRPQSVFTLDKADLSQVTIDGQPLAKALAVGETMTLPDGQGSITFDGVSRFANFQIAYDPGKEISLAAAVMLLAGLTVSLLVRRRRVWVRVRPAPQHTGTSVELAVSALTRRGSPEEELDQLVTALTRSPAGTQRPDPDPDPDLASEPAERTVLTHQEQEQA